MVFYTFLFPYVIPLCDGLHTQYCCAKKLSLTTIFCLSAELNFGSCGTRERSPSGTPASGSGVVKSGIGTGGGGPPSPGPKSPSPGPGPLKYKMYTTLSSMQ